MIRSDGKTRIKLKDQDIIRNETEVNARGQRVFHRQAQNADYTDFSRSRFHAQRNRRMSGFGDSGPISSGSRTRINYRSRRRTFSRSSDSPDATNRNFDSSGRTKIPIRGESEGGYESKAGNVSGNGNGSAFGSAGNAGNTAGSQAGNAGQKAAEAGVKTAEAGARAGGAVATGGASEALHAAKAGFNVVKKTAQTAKKQMEGAGQPEGSGENQGGAATGGTKPTEMNANSLSQGTVAAITAAVAAAANAIAMALLPLIIALLPAIVIVGCITAPLAAAMSVIDLFKADVSLKTEAFRPTVESVAEEYEIQDYTEILLSIMELESGGDAVVCNNDLMGAFKGVARDAFITANGRDINTDDSIRSAAATLAQLVAYGKTKNVDRKTIIQSYNYGQAFIDYIAQNYGGCYSDEAALTFITDPATGIAATEFDTGYANKVMEKLEGTPMAPESYAAVESEMLKYQGVKYVWGGSTPDGFDCSGLVQYVYGTLGVKLPHSAQDMYYSTKPVSSGDAQPGDLVFFTGTADTGKYVTHVGIYTGPGQMYAAGGSGVGYTNIGTQYWQTHLLGYGRIAR